MTGKPYTACIDCGIQKNAPGRSPRCRNCAGVQRRKYSTEEDKAARAKRWREDWLAKNPGYFGEPDRKALARDTRLRRLYDISSAEYEAVVAYQGGGCAICGRVPATYRLHVDHDHKTGLTRGALCPQCNKSLHERVTEDWLFKAIRYLQEPPAISALGRAPQGIVGRVRKRKRRLTHKR